MLGTTLSLGNGDGTKTTYHLSSETFTTENVMDFVDYNEVSYIQNHFYCITDSLQNPGDKKLIKLEFIDFDANELSGNEYTYIKHRLVFHDSTFNRIGENYSISNEFGVDVKLERKPLKIKACSLMSKK